MDADLVLNQLTQIFKKILDNPKIELSSNTTANDIEEWDSLTHIQLIVATEKNFKVRFTSSEIQNFKNVGEMRDCILKKLNAQSST